jgi:Ca-activated chloride channel homolog
MLSRIVFRSGALALFLSAAQGFSADQVRASAESRLVLIPVTVTDRNGKSMTGLQPQQFQIADGAEARPIHSLSREDAPVSFGIVLDLSGSMSRKVRETAAAVRAIVDAAGEEDDAFLVTFSDHPELRSPFTANFASFPNRVLHNIPSGGTALIDAVYLALDQLQRARHARRALIVISDGGDNQSRYSRAELISRAVESDAQIYTMGLADDTDARAGHGGIYLLEQLSEVTGGVHFMVRDRGALVQQAARLAEAMKCLYVLAYRPPDDSAPGKWRRVRVTLTPDVGKSLRVTSRAGYFTPD